MTHLLLLLLFVGSVGLLPALTPTSLEATPGKGKAGEGRAVAAQRPVMLEGVVRDAETGAPVPRALLRAGERWAETDAEGRYRLGPRSDGVSVVVQAAGYRKRALTPLEIEGASPVVLEPWTVRGIYLSFHTLGVGERRRALIELVERTDLNTVVLDMKTETGSVHAAVAPPLSAKIGAVSPVYPDIVPFLAELHKRGIYTVARIVVFKDDTLARARPQYKIWRTDNGLSYDDCDGNAWVDPFRREVWEYNLAVAEAAARAGFDEVQFDYVRFPSDCRPEVLRYQRESTQESRVAAITGFLWAARERLRPRGVLVAADIFGATLVHGGDEGIGQNLEMLALAVDYLSPMVYPSVWKPGALGLDYPAAAPYSVVVRSLKRGLERLQALPGVRLRPWLQGYNDTEQRSLEYGPWAIQAQIQAAFDAGAWGYMIWDPSGGYQEEAIHPPPLQEGPLELSATGRARPLQGAVIGLE